MSKIAKDSSDELFLDFLEESDELVSSVERDSIALETNPEDPELIHGIFRAVHSLKGNSSFFDFTHVQTFCHDFENFLDLVREKSIEINPEIIYFITEGSDHLKSIFGRMRDSGSDVAFEEGELNYLARIEDMIGEQTSEGKMEKLRKGLLKFFSKAKDDGELEEETPLKEVYDIINSTAPELIEDKRRSTKEDGSKWMSGEVDVSREFIDLRALVEDSLTGHPVENAYSVFMSNVDSLMQKHSDAGQGQFTRLLGEMKENFEIFYQDEIGLDEMMAVSMMDTLNEYSAGLTEIKPEKKEDARPAEAASGPVEKRGKKRTKTVRIQEGLLDSFIDQVGELITISELFNLLQRRFEDGRTDGLHFDFKSTNQAFSELCSQLQKSLYEIRKAPVSRALDKLPRLVRSLAKSFGKSMHLKMSGGETEVDKSLLDRIETILIHCVRNSVDHGLENADERAEAGKGPEGTITINVTSDENSVFIKFYDDGRGVNTGKIRSKAAERGFISREEAVRLSEQEALELLMKPGFSTADHVSETSGRGVGMDVLWSSVNEMNGRITLINKPGKGLEINISLPLAYTTRIKLGLTMTVGNSAFLVPAENVRETFKAKRDDITIVEGRGEVARRWEKIYPVVRLSELFGIKPKRENVWDSICVLAESKGEVVCLVVDEILGQRQIVYKRLTVITWEPCAFEGVSILDGRHMALILSVEGVIRQFLE